MRLEDMKNDIPETPEFIHAMIQKEVYKQMKETKVVDIQTRRIKKWTGTSVAVAAAVCMLATSMVAYAGVKLYQMFTEKQGSYNIITGINTDDSMGTIDLPEIIHGIDITAGYVPEGMEWIDEVHLQYPEQKWIGGFNFSWVLLDEDDLGKVIEDKSVIESENRKFGDYNGVYLKYHDLFQDGSINQKIYLLCPDVYRMITIYIGDNVAKEDAIKVAENLVITENDTIIETDLLDTWSEQISPEEETEIETMLTSVAADRLSVYQIGDKFEVTAHSIDEAGNWEDNKISVCVDDVIIEDSLEIIGQDRIPEEWMNAVGTDGKIVNNTRAFIKSGNGIDTVDEIVKTESIKQKLVFTTLTYTNETDEDINHMLYSGSLMLLDSIEGMYRICDSVKVSGLDYDRVSEDSVARIAEMTYYNVTEEFGNGGNYIPSLKASESIQVNMAWIVNEDALEKMYLNLSGDFGTYEFTESMLEVGVVDICQ